jgi:hypothetical protein
MRVPLLLRALFVCAGLLSLSACASYLSVQTDIYTGMSLDLVLPKQKVQEAKSKLQSKVMSFGSNEELTTSANSLIAALDQVQERFDPFQTHLRLAANEPLLRNLREFDAMASRLADDPKATDEIKRAASEAHQVVEELAQSSLQDEHMAEILKAKNEEYWQNSPANSAVVFTFLGNAEVLIRQDKRKSSDAGGEFHVKGVIFDPSQVSEAVFTTVEQSIRMLAAAYGVPTVGSSGEAPSSASGRLALREREWRAEGAEEGALLAMQSVYLELLRELEKVPANGNLLPSDVDRIRGVLDAARAQLMASVGDS